MQFAPYCYPVSDHSRHPQTEGTPLERSTPLEAMMSLQHTALEATQALVRKNLSIQEETTRHLQEELCQQADLQHQVLALSWSVFYGPLGDGEADADESHGGVAEEFRGPGATHRTLDAAGEGNDVDAAGDPEVNSRTARSDGDGVSDDHGDPAVTDAEERSEPSTEIRTEGTDGTESTGDGTTDERSAVGDRADGAENGAVTRTQPSQDRIHGIGDVHRDSLHRVGIESVVDLADERPDTVAGAADVSRERAAEWIERAGAVAARDLEVIDGIGDARTPDLHEAGIETVPALAEADEADVATAAGVSEDRAAAWVDDARRRQQTQLLIIEGIGETRADGLRDADIETLADLAAADAHHVAEAVDVSPARAAEWIRSAQA